MNFSGCGVITDWAIVGAGAGGGGTIDRVIELQLFRPDPTRSTVFTEVTSSVVTTNIPLNELSTHTFTSIRFTFSPGDVLGFYYPNDIPFLEVRRANSFSTHSVLTPANSPTASVVTATALTGTSRLFVPLMSVSGELSYLMLVHSVLYSHHCVCGYLLCVVSCTASPRSNTITGTLTVSQPGVPTTASSLSSGTASAMVTPTNSTGMPTSDPNGSDIPVGVPIAVVLVLFILAVVVAVVIIVIVVVSVRRKNSGEVSLGAVYESPLDNSYDTVSEFIVRIGLILL